MRKLLSKAGLSWKQWLVLAALAVAVILLGRSVYDLYFRYSQSKNDYEASMADFAALEKQQEQIKEKTNYLRSERGVENEVRTRFDVAKAGENVVVIVNSSASASDADVEANSHKSWWNRLTSWFGF